jgi:hypothetical protein
VSEIGFGAWAIGGSWGPQSEADSVAALNRALDLGVNFIDTAAGYGDGKSERIIARCSRTGAIRCRRDQDAAGRRGPGRRRPTARRPSATPEKYLRENVEERLRNLGTDRIDILQLHTWTRAWNRDPEPFEVLRELKGGQDPLCRRLHARARPEQRHRPDEGRLGRRRPGDLQHLRAGARGGAAAGGGRDRNVGIIVRVVFDEGSLTGKWTKDTSVPRGGFPPEITSRATGSGAPWTARRRCRGAGGQRVHASAGRDQVSRSPTAPSAPSSRACGPVRQAEANCAVSDDAGHDSRAPGPAARPQLAPRLLVRAASRRRWSRSVRAGRARMGPAGSASISPVRWRKATFCQVRPVRDQRRPFWKTSASEAWAFSGPPLRASRTPSAGSR